jgi:hypothetical protein
MKKILNIILLLLVAGSSALMVSCKDDEEAAPGTDREFMTMFICDNTRGKGTDYPYNSGLDARYPHGNTIHLYWYGVKECAGYQIQMALQPKVSGGESAWESIQGTSDLLLDTIVGPNVLDMLLKDLQYSTNYRFCIRALSPLDNNTTDFSHASNWYGRGTLRQWQEYLNITTNDRYPTPYAVYVNQAETTENDMHVYFNTNISQLGLNLNDEADQDKLKSFYENFNIDADGNLGYQYLRVQPSPNNPNSTVGEKWKYYKITDEDRQRGFVVVDGLTANSVYVIDVIDPTVPVAIDAKYNTCTARSDGQPGEPILLNHADLLAQAASIEIPNRAESRAEVFANAANYNAAPISPTLYDFISNTNYAEGQTFLLEGGKTYYLDGNDITCKGFVLRTRPEDVAQGKRARVIAGIGKSSTVFTQGTNGEQWNGCPYSMFTFGRSPEAGEGGEIYMKKLAFYDIDFDNPMCYNYGDQAAGLGIATGNYFFNMFSDGMAVTLDSLVIENCTFKRIVRGFIREQGPNYKLWNHVLIKNNQFFDCGYYSQGAGGYCWVDGSGANEASNLYRDFKAIENTFYDCPFPAFIKEEKEVSWTDSQPWKITFSNNTLINFNTRASGAIFKMRNLPNGSVYTVENNLFVLCKKPGDQRVLQMWGADIRNTLTLPDGSAGKVKLYFNNNWSTNNDLTNGSIFSGNGWSTTSNSFYKLVKDGNATLNGTLDIQVADISATELMVSPCPPHVAATANDQNMHRADALDGTANTEYNVNLYFQNTNNDIYNNNVGAARWRNKQ